MTTTPRPEAVNDHGLRRMPRIAGIGGDYIEIQESSLAGEPALWIGIVGPHGGRPFESRAALHLALSDAPELCRQLAWFVANHYQVTNHASTEPIEGVALTPAAGSPERNNP